MPGLVLVERGMRESLDALTASWFGNLSMGLHQNALPPQRDWTLAQIQVATFSGYVGLIPIVSWGAAAMNGEKAVASAAPLQWIHNGGPQAGYVCGYYVVNGNGQLVWAEKQSNPPALMLSAGQSYVVRPEFSLSSRFPTE